MQYWRGGRARHKRFLIFVPVLFLLVIGADECANRSALHDLEELIKVQMGLDPIPSSLRIHRKTLSKDDVVEPYAFDNGADAGKMLTCESDNGCWLFFIDTDHWAHFAHTTAIALLELDTGRLKGPVIDEWWPLLNDEPIFDTVGKREDWRNPVGPDPKTIVYPADYTPRLLWTDPNGIWVEERRPPVPSPTPTPDTEGTGFEDTGIPEESGAADREACNVWAVIVDGYTTKEGTFDERDTFHLDAEGAYKVVRGHGVPDENIRYLCPDPDRKDGCSFATSRGNLEAALKDTSGPNEDDPACEELLFFYSSHGGDASLRCGVQTLEHDVLSGWLDEVQCAKITIVVEACESGGLFELLESGIPDGQTRYIFTSTERDDTRTYRDKDTSGEDLDTNPGDIGSETIWGYVEAFGTGFADVSNEKEISFSEAADFATDNDITDRQPGRLPNTTTTEEAHSCAAVEIDNTLKIELNHTPIPPAGPGQLLRCRRNGLSAIISVPDGAEPPSVATARFYWTNVSDPMWLGNCETDDSGAVKCESDFEQVWDSTRLIGSHQKFPVTIDVFWNVGSNFDDGSLVTLLAIADSPQSKVPHDADTTLSELEAMGQADTVKLEIVNPTSCFLFPCGCRTVR